MQSRTKQVAPPAALGVFALIAGAASALTLKPFLMIVPLLFDTFLWLGPKITPTPLTVPVASWIRRSAGETSAEDVSSVVDGMQRVTDLSPVVALFVPSLLVGVDQAALGTLWNRSTLAPTSGWWVLPIAVAIVMFGICAGMVFRVALAHVVLEESPSALDQARAMGRASASYAVFILLLLGAFVAIAIPVSIVGVVTLAMGINIAPLLALIVAFPVVAAAILLSFVPEAIAVAKAGPIRACYLSFSVVRRNLWPSIGFVAVVGLTSSGLTLALQNVVGSPVGVVISVVLYAFVGTSLTLAQMQFFYDRLRRWRIEPAPTASRRSA